MEYKDKHREENNRSRRREAVIEKNSKRILDVLGGFNLSIEEGILTKEQVQEYFSSMEKNK